MKEFMNVRLTGINQSSGERHCTNRPRCTPTSSSNASTTASTALRASPLPRARRAALCDASTST
ncbi:hypothetical protein IG631_23305 [Alternaria alternata]|nr:hypothetical protein IG631_23305 [Alternaria alternata]